MLDCLKVTPNISNTLFLLLLSLFIVLKASASGSIAFLLCLVQGFDKLVNVVYLPFILIRVTPGSMRAARGRAHGRAGAGRTGVGGGAGRAEAARLVPLPHTCQDLLHAGPWQYAALSSHPARVIGSLYYD